MLHEYHLSKSSLAVVEDKLNHVRKHLNPDLWAETFQDDEDFYEVGYQPGDEIELFAADEAGQLAKKRLALLELAAAKAAPPEDYSLAPPVRLSVLSYSLTPPSPPSPAPPGDSPTADELAAALQLASDQSVVGECWPVRDRLVKRDEPSLVRSGVNPPNDEHFWPIFAGADGKIANPVARGLQFKRDEPDRMPDAPISGDGDDDGAEGESRLCCFALTFVVAGEDDPHFGMDYRSDIGWIKRRNTRDGF